MNKKKMNQAIQYIKGLPPEERKEIAKLYHQINWYHYNGKCHALRNPYVNY